MSSPQAVVVYPPTYKPESDREMDSVLERARRVQENQPDVVKMRRLCKELRDRGACDAFDQANELVTMVDELCEQTRGMVSLVGVLGRTTERLRPPRSDGQGPPIRIERRRSPSPPRRGNGISRPPVRRAPSPPRRDRERDRDQQRRDRAPVPPHRCNVAPPRRDLDKPEPGEVENPAEVVSKDPW